MKTLTKSNTYLRFAVLLLTFALGISTIFSSIVPSYTDPQQATNDQDPNSGGGTGYSVDDLTNKATGTISKVQSAVVKIAAGVGTLAIIVTLALLLFTHDERKISGYIKICVTIAIAMAAILLVNAGAVVSLVQDLTGQNFNK